jgi:MFS family permease
LLTVIGYGLATLTKPLFPLAETIGWVFAARFVDRIGKGVRDAPRDALVGDIAPAHLRGACYGLRQSLDTVGAFAGPLLALALMALFADDIRAVFWVAVIPAVIAVAILVFGVKEPGSVRAQAVLRSPIHLSELRGIGAAYWGLVLIAAFLSLARFSEAFLLLRAENVGLPIALVPLVMVVMNVAYAGSAYPAGVLSDRIDRLGVVVAGLVLLIAADLALALATGIWLVMGGVVLWGLHMGLTQGLLSAMVADAAPAEIRGTAFGVFHMMTGIMLLAASLIAGLLWDQVGPSATFYAGIAFTVAALAGLIAVRRHGTVAS